MVQSASKYGVMALQERRPTMLQTNKNMASQRQMGSESEVKW